MKKILSALFFLFITASSFACPVCERQKPKLLKGVTHGTGPESNWDYLIISVAICIVIAALFFSIKWMIRPGEESSSHIKRNIFSNE